MLDDDVYSLVQAEIQRTRSSFKQVVNEALRRMLNMPEAGKEGPATNDSESGSR